MLRLCLFQAVVLELERDAEKLADAGGIFVTPSVVSRLKYRVDAIPCACRTAVSKVRIVWKVWFNRSGSFIMNQNGSVEER